jgi:4-hydroxybenzoate polyprenyltransferase/phosphoserine phosphatase
LSSQVLSTCPLVVDLDGTLVKTDLLLEGLFVLLKRNPLYLIAVLLWLIKGKAYLKRQIARRVQLDVAMLPYHSELLEALQRERDKGRQLVLATAADEHVAHRVANHLQLFDAVFASDGETNLSGRDKRDRLVAEFGQQGFDYAGNSRTDLSVWVASRHAVVVNAGRGVLRAGVQIARVEEVYENRIGRLKSYVRALRLHQWFKNLLLFVAPLAAPQGYDRALLAQSALAFLSFGLCASSVYILNDLLDLADDRQHPHKRQRPFAAGDLPLLTGLILIPILLALSVLISLFLPAAFLRILTAYYTLTLAYSFYFKRIAFFDVTLLAGLYTTRMIAGCAAITVQLSAWLLGAAMLLFLSLALIKRYAELVRLRRVYGQQARARSYRVSDSKLLAILGGVCGYVAVFILALALYHGDPAQALLQHHKLVWLVGPFLLYWITHMWRSALRGGMHDDPVVFVLRDRVSQIVIACAASAILVTV